MASENTVTLVGNLTDDPELRYTPSGAAVVNFTVAVNKRFQKDGQWEDKLDGFFRCSCWREMAEHVAEMTKGTRVIVVGRLQQRNWEAQDGTKRYEVEVQVDEVGPSLRWASAQVQRSNRTGQQSGGAPSTSNFGGGSQPAQQGQPQGGQPQGNDWGAGSAVGGQMDEGGF